LYKKARQGQIKDFTGISSPYEEPMNPELVVNTSELSLEDCAEQVMGLLINRGVINPV
jgi:adenylylsulfate kinase